MGTLVKTGAAILIFAVCAFVPSQTEKSPAELPNLKLTAEVLRQDYCENSDGQTYSFAGQARLTFLNQSSEKLIMRRQFGQADIYFWIAKNSTDVSANKIEYEPRWDWTVTIEKETAPPIVPGEARPDTNSASNAEGPSDNFTILKPGESLHTESYFGVEQIRLDNTGKIQSGEHVVQFKVQLWSGDEKPEALQKQWKQYGKLVFHPIESEPMKFSLPSATKFPKCITY